MHRHELHTYFKEIISYTDICISSVDKIPKIRNEVTNQKMFIFSTIDKKIDSAVVQIQKSSFKSSVDSIKAK